MFKGPARPLDIPDPSKCKNCVNSTCPCKVQDIPVNIVDVMIMGVNIPSLYNIVQLRLYYISVLKI